MPTLLDYQYWFGYGTIGAVFGDRTNIDVVRVQGLHSQTIRSGNRLLPRSHGASPGLHLLDQKIISFELEIPDRQQYVDFLSIFRSTEIQEGELHWKMPELPQSFHRARVVARNEEQTGLTTGLIPVTIAFECADPRIYDAAERSILLRGYNPTSGGVEWDIEWEVDFTSGISTEGQDVVAHNAGYEKAYPLIRFFGPTVGTCTGVKIENFTTGEDIEINTAVLTGQILVADMSARIRGTGALMIQIDGASRYGDWELPRNTFYLAPGDNVLRFTMTGSSTDMLATLNWRDTSS